MDYIIITDSGSDLPEEFAAKEELAFFPLSFSIGEREYSNEGDDRLTPEEFYAQVRAGSMPRTSQVNPELAEQRLEAYLKQEISVLYVSFSSALSGSYQTVKMIAEGLNEKYTAAKVVVVDSLCASLGQGLLISMALDLKREGKGIDEVAEWLEEHKLHLCHYFTVNDLFHLHRGGRVSKTAAVFGSLLGVKPVLHVDDQGRLIPVAKVRGRRQSLDALVDKMKEHVGSFKNQVVFISHGDCIDDANYVRDRVEKEFGIHNIMVGFIGPVIGSHSGPGTVALFFLGETR